MTWLIKISDKNKDYIICQECFALQDMTKYKENNYCVNCGEKLIDSDKAASSLKTN